MCNFGVIHGDPRKKCIAYTLLHPPPKWGTFAGKLLLDSASSVVSWSASRF